MTVEEQDPSEDQNDASNSNEDSLALSDVITRRKVKDQRQNARKTALKTERAK